MDFNNLEETMDTYQFILLQQQNWETERREKNDKYLDNLNRCYEEYLKLTEEYHEIENPNLYIPLSKESHREIFKDEDKREKIANWLITVDSSMVLQLNIFEYWRQKKDGYKHIANILGVNPEGIINMHYEGLDNNNEYKFKIYPSARNHPQPDIFFEYETGLITAIECKFKEPYENIALNHKNTNWIELDNTYLSGEREPNKTKNWVGLDNFRKFIENQCKNDITNEFKFIDIKQIVTHILGLNKIMDNTGKIRNREKSQYSLIYLYFPPCKINEKNELIIYDERYDNEIKKIQSILSRDGVQFYSKTWIEILVGFVKKCKEGILDNEDKKYLKYNFERYFPKRF